MCGTRAGCLVQIYPLATEDGKHLMLHRRKRAKVSAFNFSLPCIMSNAMSETALINSNV